MRLAERDERLMVQLFRFIDVLPALRTEADVARHLREYLDPRRVQLPLPLALLLDYDDSREGIPAGVGAREDSRASDTPAGVGAREDSRTSDIPAGVGARRDSRTSDSRTSDSRTSVALRARLAARWARLGPVAMARRFITGSTADEAVQTLLDLRSRRMAFTLDVLGEATTSQAEARQHQHVYLELLESLCPAAAAWPEVTQIDRTRDGLQPRVNISVKFSGLDAQIAGLDPNRFVRNISDRMRPILRRARELGAFINVDMESFATRDVTIESFKRLMLEDEFRDWPNVGIVVQAYLKDGEADLLGLLDWVERRGTPIAIRLVKGAYWDYETTVAIQKGNAPPVWTRKWESDASFERLSVFMLQAARQGLIRPACASHNVRSLAAVMATAEEFGLAQSDYEIQMLYGMGDPLKTAVAGMGCCLRVYSPYGDLVPGMAYLIRRLLENTSNDSFLKQSFGDRASRDRLLADPAIAQPASAPLPHRHYQNTDEDDPMIELTHAPEVDFAKPANRERMLGAIRYVRGEFGREYPLLIDHQPVHSLDNVIARNPAAPQEIIGLVAVADRARLDLAVDVARRAWAAWRRRNVAERCQPLRRAVQALEARRLEFAATLVLEGGRPWREADREVAQAIDLMNCYIAHMEAFDARPRRRDLPGETNRLAYGSKGIIAMAAAHDFAFWEPAGTITAALAAGNAVLFAPRSQRGVTAARLVTLLVDAGLPAGVIALLPDGTPRGDQTLHSNVEWVEPGGAALRMRYGAIIVDDDADLDHAVVGVIQSAFECAGQRVDACRRVIVAAPIYDAFCTRLTEATRGLSVGPAEDPETILIGPLADEATREQVRSVIELGRREARVLIEVGTEHLPSDGFYVGPTIFADVRPNTPLARAGFSGPVLLVMQAPDFETALDLARGSLSAGVYSRSPAHIELARRELLAGNVFINRKITGARVDIQPLGADGARIGGADYLLQFLRVRSITENTLRHGLAAAEEAEPVHVPATDAR